MTNSSYVYVALNVLIVLVKLTVFLFKGCSNSFSKECLFFMEFLI